MSEETRHERGMRLIEEIHGAGGAELVDSLGDLGRYVVEFAFGDVYSRGGLSLRERQITTVAALTALSGREPQLRIHLRASLEAGLSPEELEEIVIHTVPYAGFPTAINALLILREVVAESSAEGPGRSPADPGESG